MCGGGGGGGVDNLFLCQVSRDGYIRAKDIFSTMCYKTHTLGIRTSILSIKNTGGG